MDQDGNVLSRKLLYTELTRAKKLAILVGPAKAIELVVNRVIDRQGYPPWLIV